MAPGSNAPTIIKRRKVVSGGGHHGGAWKVAYADFVTAMMAFFLLMWLLNATTEQQRKGLADYFAPSIPVSRVSGGSDGMFGGASPASPEPMAGGGAASAGVARAAALAPGEGDDDALAAAAEAAELMAIEDLLLGRGGESLLSDEALRHVVTRLTDEGLVIELFSREGAPLFAGGTAEPRPVTRELLGAVARAAGLVTNPVAVGAHLPAGAPDPWASSAARAEAARAGLVAGGLDGARLARVTGHADRAPAVADGAAVRNDRLEVTLLRRAGRAAR